MDDDLKRIAGRIRNWRDQAGLTLQQLGDQSGVSASTIHKIENLQTVPTIAVLLKVANGLDRRPSELLAEAETGKQFAILHAGDRQKLTIEGRAKLEHLTSMIPRNRLDVWRIEVDAGSGSHDESRRVFEGEIVLLVESGSLEYEVGSEIHKIGPGDSIHLDASVSHRWSVTHGQPAILLAFALLPERYDGDFMSKAGMYPHARNSHSAESGRAALSHHTQSRER